MYYWMTNRQLFLILARANINVDVYQSSRIYRNFKKPKFDPQTLHLKKQ